MNDTIQTQPEFAALAVILRKLCADRLDDLTPSTRVDELPGMDSLVAMHVLALMEIEFGVEIDTSWLERIEFVEDFATAVREARPPRAPSPVRLVA